MAKKAPAGAPSWIVTFADLMSLLVCFFVLIISFSVPDIQKLKIAAGSIRDAFGFTREIRVTGVVELEGNPMYEFAQDVQPITPEETIGPVEEPGHAETQLAAEPAQTADANAAAALTEDQEFARIQEQLQQAMAASPLLAGMTDNLHVEMTPEGLKIELIDQARRSMFPLGSARMHEPTKALLREVAAAVGNLPNRIEISGHTDSYRFRRRDGYDNWSLSLDRANETRRELLGAGLAPARIEAVIGRADTAPMIADDPFDPRNRRISMTLLRQAPETTPAAASRSPGRRRDQDQPGGARRNSLYDIVPRF